jgi:hypothetical protein
VTGLLDGPGMHPFTQSALVRAKAEERERRAARRRPAPRTRRREYTLPRVVELARPAVRESREW